MARQVRSAATRRKLLDAAVDVFSEVGYSAAGRVAIIERAGVTKGALYHHFDSMDALVSALIDEGSAKVLDAFRGVCSPSSPALEGMIHGTFAATDALVADRAARVATQLAVGLGKFNDSAVRLFIDWHRQLITQARQAIAQGDLRADLDPGAVAESIISATLGTWLTSRPESDGDPIGHLTRMWELLLPGMVAEASLPYFRQFLARETLRYRVGATPE